VPAVGAVAVPVPGVALPPPVVKKK